MTQPYINTKTDPQSVIPHLVSFPMSNVAIKANSIVAVNTSGYLVEASADATLIVVGRARSSKDNSTGSAGDLSMDVEVGAFDYEMGSAGDALTIAEVGDYVYASDYKTVNKTSSSGTRPVAGILWGVYTPSNSSTVRAIVLMGFAVTPTAASAQASLYAVAGSARAVITSQSSLNAYTGSGTGVLTAGSNGAMGAQDGVTLVAGDLVFLPAVVTGATITAKDIGPYVVTSLGGASAKIVLTRPTWWANGATIALASDIKIGGEGTKWGGSSWRTFCAAAKVVGTDDPVFYPRVDSGVGAVGTQVTLVYARNGHALSGIDVTTAAAVKIVVGSPGAGTATLDFTGTGTDAVWWSIFNF